MKTYIKTSIEINNIRLESQMMAGSDPSLNDEVTTGAQLSHGRRGSWGSLWDEED